MILLIGNYPHDKQESMQRFATMLQRELRKRGLEAELLIPRPLFGLLLKSGSGLGKWLGYIDKFVLFPIRLKSILRFHLRNAGPGGSSPMLVAHICDHSNAYYGSHLKKVPWLVTCHDLLAARGALGEPTGCPASFTGKILQKWILRGLGRAPLVVCDSTATKSDVERLLAPRPPRTRTILLGLNHQYGPVAPEVRDERLAGVPGLRLPFVLLVGSNQPRKNPKGSLRIFQRVAADWDGQLVFAGQGFSPELLVLAESLGIGDKVLSIVKPGNDLLEALYNKATALLFPSHTEGFGWPIIEAQACGCPVVCSDSGPLPQVAGDAALIFDVEDEAGFASAILRLTDAAEREKWVRKGFENIKRFQTARMIEEYIQAYRDVANNGK